MSTEYGNKINVSGYTSKYWRAILNYSVTISDKKVTVKCKSGFQFTNTNYSGTASRYSKIEDDKVSPTGSWTVPQDGTLYINPASGTKTIEYTRGTSDSTKTINFSSYIAGSFCPGTSKGSASIKVPALKSYTLKFNANGGTGTIANKTKYYGKDITLPSSGFTRSGYTFLGWSTSSSATEASYKPGATYKNDESNTFYAIWKANLILPTISNFKVERYNEDGDQDDEGIRCHISMTYSKSTLGGVSQPMTYSVKVASTVIVPSTPLNIDGGTLSEIIPGTYDINTAQEVTVVINVNGSTVSKTETLPTADFPIDILADGSAVGIMMPAQRGVKVSIPQLMAGPMPGSDTPIYAKGSGAYAYYGVKNNLGVTLGGFGIGSDYRPRFWDANANSSKHMTINSFDTTGTDAQFVVETYSGHSSVSVGTTGKNSSYNITKPGYYPIGIVGFYVSDVNVLVRACYLNNVENGKATINYYMRSVSGTNTVTQTTRVLWIKI